MTLVLANVLAAVSALLSLLFLLGVLVPRRFFTAARRFMESSGAAGAVGARLLLAALLWFSAPGSLTPSAFRILALLIVAGAAGAFMLGTDRILKVIDRMAGWPPAVARLPIAIGLVLCAFMLWSISPAIGEF